MRYFVFVGGALLALLLIVNACLPALPVAQTSQQTADLSVIRIHSSQKWPERVVFDTTRPTIAPAPVAVAAAAETPLPQKTAGALPLQKTAAAQPLKGQVRDAYAQMPNPNEPRNAEAKRKKRSVAKNYAAPPPRMLVAQQPPVVLFGNNVW
jgi:hypothetical protein